LQVEYANECTKRGNTCAFVHLEKKKDDDEDGEDGGSVIIAVMKSKKRKSSFSSTGSGKGVENGARTSSNSHGRNINSHGNKGRSTCITTATPKGSTGLYRISDGILCKMTGLEGDGRLLARHLQSVSHQLAWTEGVLSSSSTRGMGTSTSTSTSEDANTCTRKSAATATTAAFVPSVQVTQIARLCGEVQHSLTIRSGARPLGVDAVFMGTTIKSNNRNSNNLVSDVGVSLSLSLGLFHCTVGGIVNQCEFCACGKDSHLVLKELDVLMNEYKNHDDDDIGDDNNNNNDTDKVEIETIEKSSSALQKMITGVSRVVLKPMSGGRSRSAREYPYDDDNNDESSNGLVDVYAISINPKCRGGIQISCALCVSEEEINHVAELFEEEDRLLRTCSKTR